MTTLTAYTKFDSRAVQAFKSSDTVTILRGSEITLTDTSVADLVVSLTFTGSFKPINAKGSYGTAKLLSFYTVADPENMTDRELAYTIAGTWPLAVDVATTGTTTEATTTTISFPNTEGFASNKLFAGNDNYLGSVDDDWFNIYDIHGRNSYYGMDGDDCIQLPAAAQSVANGGNGNDLIISQSSRDKLTGDAGNDLFVIGAFKIKITDFDGEAGDDGYLDKLVLPKSYFDEKIFDSWNLISSTGVLPVELFKASDPEASVVSYVIDNEDYIKVVEGIKSAKGLDYYFYYDMGTGGVYFDQDGEGKKAPALIATLENKPFLTEENIKNSLVFIGDSVPYRDAWATANWEGFAG